MNASSATQSGKTRVTSRSWVQPAARALLGAPARGRPVARALVGTVLCIALGAALVALTGCRATKPEPPQSGTLTLDLAVVPQILPADTTRRATVWVTVLEGGEPVPDSTRVWLVATAGTLPSEVFTTDGLATTSYRPSLSTGIVTLIAQVKGVRDTMNLTVF